MPKLKLKVGRTAGFSDFFNWRGYSVLQKLLIVVIAVIAFSWLSSMWTLIIILIVTIALGIHISQKISQKDHGEQFIEAANRKCEECLHYLGSLYVHFKFIAFGHGFSTPEERSNGEVQDEDGNDYFATTGKDLFNEEGASGSLHPAVKVPSDVYLEINSLQLLIIRDFVQSWYSDFSYNPEFLKESKNFLQQACNNIVYTLSCQDIKNMAVLLIKNFQVHVGMYLKAKSSYESHQIHPKVKLSESSEKATFKRHVSIDDAFENEFKLHHALSSDETEYAYLRGVMSIFLLSIVPNNIIDGKCTKLLLIEILTTNVMLPLVELISDPDWLMEKIILITSDEPLLIPENSDLKNEPEDFVNDFLNFDNDSRVVPKKVEEEEVRENLTSVKGPELSPSSRSSPVDLSDPLSKAGGSVVDEEAQDLISLGDNVSTNEFFSPLSDSTSGTSEDVIDNTLTTSCDNKDSSISSGGDITMCAGVEEVLKNSGLDCTSESGDRGDSVKVNGVESEDTRSQMDDDDSLSLSSSCASNLRKISDFDIINESFENQNATSSLKSLSLESTNGISDESVEEEGESDRDKNTQDELQSSQEIFSSDSYENIQVDPQQIISYVTPSDSAEPVSTPFLKFSSIRNFLVDSFKANSKTTSSSISKPKSLALFSDKITSNFNPLSSKLLSKKGEHRKNEQNQKPPELLVDGKPVIDLPSESTTSESLESSQTQDDIESPLSAVSTETTSPRFFSHFHPFFSKSSSQTDLDTLTSENFNESPNLTPSPSSGQPNSLADSVPGQVDYLPDQQEVQTDVMSKSYVGDDRRIFQDISIPLTLTQKEFGSNSKYSLYVIEYDALYFTEEGKSVLRSGTVKRRYREFNNLQSRLEGYPTYKKYLKNIKGPKRWPTLPFKTLDKDTVKNRRIFMEKYLRDLIQIEAICNGPDLREFLAYEGDSHIAFVKRSPDVNVLRIDKMLMRGMSEVVDRLKALPNIPQEVISGLRGRDSANQDKATPGSHVVQDADTIEVEFEFDGHSNDALGSVLSDACQVAVSDPNTSMEEHTDFISDMSQVINDLKGSDTIRVTYQQEIEKVLALITRSQHSQRHLSSSTSSDAGLADNKKGGVPVDLSEAVLDLVAQGLEGQDHWLCRENVIAAVKTATRKILNSYLEGVVSDLTSKASLVTYLRLARKTVWPQGQLWTEARPSKTTAQKEATRQQAKRCLIHFFPLPLRVILGQEEFEAMIDVFLGTLHDERLNRHILYQLVDSLLERLFPKVTDKVTLHQLLFARASSADGYV